MQLYFNSRTSTWVLCFADFSLTVPLIYTQIAFAWYGKNCGYLRSKVIKLFSTGLHLSAAAVHPSFVAKEVQQKHFLCGVFCLFYPECFSSEALIVCSSWRSDLELMHWKWYWSWSEGGIPPQWDIVRSVRIGRRRVSGQECQWRRAGGKTEPVCGGGFGKQVGNYEFHSKIRSSAICPGQCWYSAKSMTSRYVVTREE